MVLFYVLSPLPTLIARRYIENSGSSSTAAYELAIFLTMGFVVSSFALPIVLARSPEHEPVVSLTSLNFSKHAQLPLRIITLLCLFYIYSDFDFLI